MAKVVALVVAAGRGARMGVDMPKQYLDLGGMPVLRRTLGGLAANPNISMVQAVINPDDRALYDVCAQGLSLPEPIAGGSSRQESVRLGLEGIAALKPDLVLIHDGARPFVDAGLIHRVIEALKTHQGALPALAVVDTLKRGQDGLVADTVDRNALYRAQTPQGFRYGDILAAHQQFKGQELTDDAALAEAFGLKVALVQGDEGNFKLTTPHDLARALNIVTSGTGEFRTGTGFDVHRFATGTAVWLCGLEVPHTHKLEGHSDADVALHAITDALLGAISAGDIGKHFPPTDARWKGASSDRFLAHAGQLIQAQGGRIINIDLTIMCEAPKIGPHRGAMQARVAEILGLAQHRVSIKATTTEGLGFTGRNEGMAAQAAASVWLPC